MNHEYRVVYTHLVYGLQHMHRLTLKGAQRDAEAINKRGVSVAHVEVRETKLVVVKDWEEV